MSAGAHPAGRSGRAPRGPAGDRPGPGTATGTGRLSTPEDLARGFVTLFLEVEAGLRPRRHITPLMCRLLVARMAGTWVRPGPAARLVRVDGSQPSPTAFEAVAVVQRGRRFGAIGIRLSRRGRGWRVEDLVRPELGPLPPVPYLVPLEDLDAWSGGQEEPAPRRRSLQRASSQPVDAGAQISG